MGVWQNDTEAVAAALAVVAGLRSMVIAQQARRIARRDRAALRAVLAEARRAANASSYAAEQVRPSNGKTLALVAEEARDLSRVQLDLTRAFVAHASDGHGADGANWRTR